jgi:hypothetical protein
MQSKSKKERKKERERERERESGERTQLNQHNTYVNAPFLGQFRQGSGHRMKFQVHSPLGNNLALSLSFSISSTGGAKFRGSERGNAAAAAAFTVSRCFCCC